ncbi:hypothetical protein AB0I60_27370 [Actinosynnema sp. NPDC050436]|uniref:AraC-like ligand-binding domain-containing protein n=1 Tax=Actinosynnema sp. NPDC050436 TaxID=3155659 RepID=UPI0033E382C9
MSCPHLPSADRPQTAERDGADVPSVRVSRPTRLIRRSDPEAYQVKLMLDGAALIGRADREAVPEGSEFTLYDTSRPLSARRWCLHGGSVLLVQVPRSRLPVPANLVGDLTAVPFSARDGIGTAFARWLVDLTGRADEFTPVDVPTPTAVTVDLLAATLAIPAHAQRALTPQSRRRAFRMTIDGYEPGRLDPPTTARTVPPRAITVPDSGDSVQLHKNAPTTNLAGPRFAEVPVHRVAAGWGTGRSRALQPDLPPGLRHDAE